jgi:hypothetical protein
LQELHLDGNPLIDPVVPSEFMGQLLQAFKNLILFNGQRVSSITQNGLAQGTALASPNTEMKQEKPSSR